MKQQIQVSSFYQLNIGGNAAKQVSDVTLTYLGFLQIENVLEQISSNITIAS